MRRLPPLAAVRAFEAAARHEHFTAAAEELGMTQAAVSYQIKLLEERLGLSLFRRERRRVVLTEAGRRIAPQISRAFELIDTAFADVRGDDAALLTISTTKTFANAWLAWHLGSFQMTHPDLAVRLSATDQIVDLESGEVDLAIRVGRGEWLGLVCEKLLTVDFTPMCSPAFLERHGGRLEPADLLHLPVISEHDPWWAFWLREAGVEVPERPLRPGVRLDSQADEGPAAMAGLGIAMLTPFFWRKDLADGRLVQPFGQVSSRGYAYWLVYSERRRLVPKLRWFRDWVHEQVAASLAQFQ